jgi:4-hydroxy-tetrahydrodipicolinate synthase
MLAGINDYFNAGAGVLVAHPPIQSPAPVHELAGWYRALLDRLEGPCMIYNIPSTTKVSIPLHVVQQLALHPRLVGVKDSENDPARLEELLRRFAGRESFSVVIGVGSFMLRGLKLGASCRASAILCPGPARTSAWRRGVGIGRQRNNSSRR